MSNPDTFYRLGIMLAATEAQLAERPTIDKAREAHAIRRQMQEA